MEGFDGDSERAAELRAALRALLDVFPAYIAKSQTPTWFEPDEIARNDQFDAIVRAHKKDRLALPIQALRMTGAAYHGFDLMHPRRLAWFVPSLLASWLDRAPGWGGYPFAANDIASMMRNAQHFVEEWWTEDEDAALATFFAAALAAALTTTLRPAQEPTHPRPLEDGVRVWSLHAPSVPLEVLRVANALRVPLDPLVAQWAFEPAELAVDHLLEAVYDPAIASKHLLSDEAVANRLGEAFFDATGERQARISKAEATVRRNIARREDF